MNPIPIQTDFLKIKSVQLNGVDYQNFDKDNRTISIQPNQGGKFKVTFENSQEMNTSTTTANHMDYLIKYYATTNTIQVGHVSDIAYLQLTDLSGRVVLTQKNNYNETIHISTSRISSGIYIITLTKKDGTQFFKKILIN